MADEMRSCRKTACRWPAASSLSFRYATKEVWLLDLSEEPDPNLYDLCPHHADALTVPKGWERVDQRSSPDAPVEPAASDRMSSSGRPAARDDGDLVSAGSGQRGTRYDALAAELPRLAAEWANGAWGEDPRRGPQPAAEPGEDLPGQLAIPVEEREAAGEAVVVSIEMARRPSGA